MTTSQVSIPPRARPLLETIGRIADGQGASAYAVGGCVRDWMLGIASVTDLDVVVEGPGLRVARAAANAFGGVVKEHPPFGTATLVLRRKRWKIDVATCRKETYVRPAAYPQVAPGTLEEDLFRRDFTINAMAIALSPGCVGTLIDPFHGAQDVRQKLLRILHERSFIDDPSRILRGVRFAQRLGFRWDTQTERAARDATALGALGWLNAGRVERELERMGREPNPRACLEQLAGLLDA